MIWLVATLVCFYVARYISGKIKNPLLNPLLITLIVLIVLLKWLQVPYEVYFADNKIINFLLGPAVVALALPLYQQLAHIRSKWKTIMTACFVGSVLSMTFGTAIAFWMELMPNLLPVFCQNPLLPH